MSFGEKFKGIFKKKKKDEAPAEKVEEPVTQNAEETPVEQNVEETPVEEAPKE